MNYYQINFFVIYMSYTYQYPRPAITVDAIVTAERNGEQWVLLIRRKAYPFEGKWALPGGFVNMDETLAESCQNLFNNTFSQHKLISHVEELIFDGRTSAV